MYRILPKQVGRRGVCLLAISYQSFSIGWTQIEQPPQDRAAEAYQILFEVATPCTWGWAWIIVGVVCLAGAFSARVRNAAYALSLFLLTVMLIGFTLAAIGGAYRGWASVGWYAAQLVIFEVLAGWPEPGHTKVPHHWRRRGAE